MTVIRSAVIDGDHRYRLDRRWGTGPPVVYVMLNPSTADGSSDDATLRRCTSFAQSWGAPALVVVNLYSFRAKKPDELVTLDRCPCPPAGDLHVAEALHEAAFVVCAWGANAGRIPGARRRAAELRLGTLGAVFGLCSRCGSDRAGVVLDMVRAAGHRPSRLGPPTADGSPRHPLYLSASTRLELIEVAW